MLPQALEFRKVVFHVDMDSFYASCELSQRPELRENPYVVGADPMGGAGRGVVLACNYPARKFGLRSGMPISRAWQLCPQARYEPPHFELYDEVSARVMKLLKLFADKLEQVSIDEAYLDVTERVKTILEDDPKQTEFEMIKALAQSITKEVYLTEKITCSIGVAQTKIVAKIATDMNKPNGLTIITPARTLEFLAPLEVSRIPGVGTVTQKTLLEKFSIKTVQQLRKVPVDDLKSVFGKSANWLVNVASGIDESDVVERWDPISLSGETTFFQDEGDYTRITEAMRAVAQDVHQRVVKEGYLFKSVGIKIRFTGFETHTRSKSLKACTDSLEIMNKECEVQLSEFSASGKKVRLIGVRISSLVKKDNAQRSLIDWQDEN